MIKDDNNRRKTLRKEEPIFRQQSPALRIIGGAAAEQTLDFGLKAILRDLDLLVWDESERYFHRFAEDLDDAPSIVQDLLSETADAGSHIGMEFTLPPLVLAFVKVRIFAGGDDVYKKHYHLLCAIESSQRMNRQTKPLFDKFCKFLMLNKKDSATGEETIYRRGDPMERLKDTEEEKANAKTTALLGQILEATKGWNSKDAFGDYWEQWMELWVYLLKQEEIVEKVSQKDPNSRANNTSINITLVCNVAGLMKKHLEKVLRRPALSDTNFADKIKNSWTADTRRRKVSETTEIKDKVIQINGWLAMNVK